MSKKVNQNREKVDREILIIVSINSIVEHRIDTERLPDATTRNVAEKYLGVGEFMFDSTVAAAHASKYFIRSNPTSTAPLPSGIDKLEQPKPASSSWWK